MTESVDPPQDPDGTLDTTEALDEDQLRVDPLEAGMDPPEGWSGVEKYGMTPYEQAHPQPLDDRLAEERPEQGLDQGAADPDGLTEAELDPGGGQPETLTGGPPE